MTPLEKYLRAFYSWHELQVFARCDCPAVHDPFPSFRASCKFYNKFKPEIWEAVDEVAREYKFSNIFDLLSKVPYAGRVKRPEDFKRLMSIVAIGWVSEKIIIGMP